MKISIPIERIREALIADAIEKNSRYPQYAGYHDDMVLYNAVQDVDFHGRIIKRGTLLIGTQEVDYVSYPSVTCYDHTTGNGFHVAMPTAFIERIS